jgi:hypothetical protein
LHSGMEWDCALTIWLMCIRETQMLSSDLAYRKMQARDPGGTAMTRAKFLRVLINLMCIAVVCSTLFAVAAPSAHATPGNGNRKKHSIHLTWEPNKTGNAVVGYNIYRSRDGGQHFRKLNRSPVPKPEFDDKKVRRGQTYLYVVKGVDANGVESLPSNQIKLSVP